MAPNEQLSALSAVVKTESGRRVTLRKGDALPTDAAPGEAERLRALGVFGPPKSQEVDDRDEAQVLADDLAAQHAELFGGEETAVEDTGEPETPEPEEDRIGLAAFLQTASVKEVLARIEQEPDLAPVLLEIERESDEPRKTLVAGLETAVEDTGE